MRAMRLGAPVPIAARPLEAVRADVPEPGTNELVIDVEACAVCRTDLQLVEGDLPARRLPIVPGHQVTGRVAALGDDVSGWAVGDRAAAIWLASADGTCGYCTSGRENLCREARTTIAVA